MKELQGSWRRARRVTTVVVNLAAEAKRRLTTRRRARNPPAPTRRQLAAGGQGTAGTGSLSALRRASGTDMRAGHQQGMGRQVVRRGTTHVELEPQTSLADRLRARTPDSRASTDQTPVAGPFLAGLAFKALASLSRLWRRRVGVVHAVRARGIRERESCGDGDGWTVGGQASPLTGPEAQTSLIPHIPSDTSSRSPAPLAV